jgi:hypothetical protein
VPLPLALWLGVALRVALGVPEALSGTKVTARTRPLSVSDT